MAETSDRSAAVTCATCGAPLEHTEVGEVDQFAGHNVQHRYGTINHPCGCLDGGLHFDFTKDQP